MPAVTKAVFVSYASQDAEAARRLCDRLRRANIEVWFDQSELRGGDAWDHKIRRQIQDCFLFIPVISAHTQLRTEGYFRLEWHLADQRRLLMSKSRPFLVPVVLDGTPNTSGEVPDSFAAVQWTHLPAGEGTPEFIEHILRLLDAAVSGTSVQVAAAGTSPQSAPPDVRVVHSTKRLIALSFAAAVVALAVAVAARFYEAKNKSPGQHVPAPSRITASLIAEKSIAVLPFSDMSEKRDQEYFSDGLAAELIDLLARTPGLHVIARTSSFSFKGKPDDIPTIAAKLRVANILEGSVRKAGDRVRVTTQLIQAASGEPLWSETYDRELRDIFAIQDEISAAVVSQLKLKLGATSSPGTRRIPNVAAYNEYLLGQQLYFRGSFDGYRRAIEAYRRAIQIDPNYAAAYAGLAHAEFFVADDTADAAGYRRAEEGAEKAVQLGPEESGSYAARGFIRRNRSFDWDGALADYEKAIALDPGDAYALNGYGSILTTFGRLSETIAVTKKSIDLDPLSSNAWEDLVFLYSFTRNFGGADEASRRALEISPDSVYALKNLAVLQLLERKTPDALQTSEKVVSGPWRLYGIAMAQHSLKNSSASQKALDELIAENAAQSAYQIADVYAWRGEPDKAFHWLERAYLQRDAGLININIDPLVDSLRADPRYKALLQKLKLPEPAASGDAQ